MLQQKYGMARSIDLARHMGYSKPSISHAVGVLRDGGFLTVDPGGFFLLTDIGREIAEKWRLRLRLPQEGHQRQDLLGVQPP